MTLAKLSVLAMLSVLVLLPLSAGATPPSPSYGTAVVDGNYGEWNLSADFFANMYRAGNPTKPLEAKLYLRYDCSQSAMYVLVLVEPGPIGLVDTTLTPISTGWVAIDTQSNKVVNDQAGNDGNPPDFAWIDLAYDGDPTHVHGFEASFLITPDNYEIIVHQQVYSGGSQTTATTGFPNSGPPLEIFCEPVPTRPTSWSGIKLRSE